MISIRSLLLVFFIGLSLHFITPIAHAQSFALSLYPEQQTIVSKSSQTVTLPYSLTNLGDPQLLVFKIYKISSDTNSENYELIPYEVSESGPQFAVINATMELGKPFLMNGKSTVLFDIELTIPENTKNQDYYFTLVAESQGMEGSEGTSSIQLEGGVGGHILLTVTDTGRIENSAQISSFTIPNSRIFTFNGETYSLISSGSPIPLSLTITNTGINYIKASGTIQSTSTTPFKIPETSILSSSQKSITTEITSSKPIGTERFIATIQIGNSQVLYSSVNVLIIPVKILIVLTFLIVCTAGLYYFLKKRNK